MISIREQIYEILGEINSNVTMTNPEDDDSGTVTELPLIVYAEIVNINRSKWLDEIQYQIDVYDNDFIGAVELMFQVDAAMRDLGFKRTYVSPDTNARQGKDLYKKVANYTGIVNTHDDTIVKGE